jgi:ornithine carbamoyltransferase
MNLQGRNLLKETDLSAAEFLDLVELGRQLRLQKRMGLRNNRLAGRNIALIFEKTSTRTRSAFEVAAHDEGAHVTCAPSAPCSAPGPSWSAPAAAACPSWSATARPAAWRPWWTRT